MPKTYKPVTDVEFSRNGGKTWIAQEINPNSPIAYMLSKLKGEYLEPLSGYLYRRREATK